MSRSLRGPPIPQTQSRRRRIRALPRTTTLPLVDDSRPAICPSLATASYFRFAERNAPSPRPPNAFLARSGLKIGTIRDREISALITGDVTAADGVLTKRGR